MSNKSKKILSLLLAIALIFGMIPFGVLAADTYEDTDTSYELTEAPVEADGETIEEPEQPSEMLPDLDEEVIDKPDQQDDADQQDGQDKIDQQDEPERSLALIQETLPETAAFNGEIVTITFLGNGGTIPGGQNQRTVELGESLGGNMPDTDVISRPNFALMNWNTQQDGNGVVFTGETIVDEAFLAAWGDVNANTLNIFAQWGHSVRFFANGGTQTADLNRIRVIPSGLSINAFAALPGNELLAWPNVTRLNLVFGSQNMSWRFLGWYDTNTLEGGVSFDGDTPLNGNVDLHARWDLGDILTVTFHGNGGDVTGLTTRQAYRGSSVLDAASTAVPVDLRLNGGFPNYRWPASTTSSNWRVMTLNGTTVTRSGGWILRGWSTNDHVTPADLNAEGALFLTNTNVYADTDIYAVWARQVTFSLQGGTIGDSSSNQERLIFENEPIQTINAAGRYTPLAISSSFGQTHVVGMPPDPTRLGFIFDGWVTTINSVIVPVDGDTDLSSMSFPRTIIATWTAGDDVTITFVNNSNDATEIIGNTRTIPQGANMEAMGSGSIFPTHPTRQGYVFMGWHTRAFEDSTTRAPDEYLFTRQTIVNEDITVYAFWMPSFRITLSAGEGSWINGQDRYLDIPVGMSITDANRRQGSVALGGLPLGYRPGSLGIMSTFNTLLAAPREGYEPAHSRDLRERIPMSNLSQILTGRGWPGDLWNTRPDGSGEFFRILPGSGSETRVAPLLSDRVFDSDITLYLMWSPTVDLLTFDYNRRSVNPSLSDINPVLNAYLISGRTINNQHELQHHSFPGGYAPPAEWWPFTVPAPTGMPGFAFLGWNTQEDGLGEWFTANTPASPNTDITGSSGTAVMRLYARWHNQVAFHPGEAPLDVIMRDIPAGGGTVAWPADLVWPGGNRMFIGWFNETGAQITHYQVFSTATTLTARWGVEVTLDPTGGSLHSSTDNPLIVRSGTAIGGLPTLNLQTPTRAGHGFIGWNTQADGNGIPFTQYAPIVSDYIELFAQWDDSLRAVTFDGNGGIFERIYLGNDEYYDVRQVARNATFNQALGSANMPNAPENGSRVFIGWFDRPDASGGTEFTAETIVTANRTVYARWQGENQVIFHQCESLPNFHNVSGLDRSIPFTFPLVLDESVAAHAATVDMGHWYGFPGVPGRVFRWYTSEARPTTAAGWNNYFDLSTPITSDMLDEDGDFNLYAHWIQLGDVNGNNTLNTADLTLLQQYFLMLIDRSSNDIIVWHAADVNVNDVLNTADLTLLQQHFLMLNPVLGVPAPQGVNPLIEGINPLTEFVAAQSMGLMPLSEVTEVLAAQYAGITPISGDPVVIEIHGAIGSPGDTVSVYLELVDAPSISIDNLRAHVGFDSNHVQLTGIGLLNGIGQNGLNPIPAQTNPFFRVFTESMEGIHHGTRFARFDFLVLPGAAQNQQIAITLNPVDAVYMVEVSPGVFMPNPVQETLYDFEVIISFPSTLNLNNASLTVNDANLVVSTGVSGTATGDITLGTYTALPGVTVAVVGDTIEVTGVRPAVNGTTVSGSFTVPVNRGGMSATLTVNVYLTPRALIVVDANYGSDGDEVLVDVNLPDDEYEVEVESDRIIVLIPDGDPADVTVSPPSSDWTYSIEPDGDGGTIVTLYPPDDSGYEFEVGDGPEYPILIYITVTFDAGAHGTFAGAQQQTTERVRRGTVLDATTVPTANANAGYAFTGWTPSNPVGHTVLAAITFTAQFDAREIGINVDNDGDITVTVPEGDSYNVDSNGTIVITLPDADPEDNITVTLPNNNWNYEISEDDDGNIIVIITRPATPGPGPGGPVGGGGGITVLPDTQVPLDPAPERFFAPYHNAFLVGSPDGTVRPQANITRAEVATILFRLLNDEFRASVWSQSNNFTDVSSDAWFNNAISTMSNAGIITGNNGAFRPNDAVTRAEFAAMIARFFTEFEAEDVSYFVDIEGNWAEDYINLIAQFGWIQGAGDGTFNPNAQMTRAEAAAIVNRMLERVIDGQDGLLYGRTRFPDVTNANAWYYLYLQEATHSTLFERQENGRVVWTTILPHLDWTVLERPHSTPRAIEAARQVQMEAADDVA